MSPKFSLIPLFAPNYHFVLLMFANINCVNV